MLGGRKDGVILRLGIRRLHLNLLDVLVSRDNHTLQAVVLFFEFGDLDFHFVDDFLQQSILRITNQMEWRRLVNCERNV